MSLCKIALWELYYACMTMRQCERLCCEMYCTVIADTFGTIFPFLFALGLQKNL